jgi:hypothetical protein
LQILDKIAKKIMEGKKISKNHKIFITYILSLIVFLGAVNGGRAETIIIENDVRANANTGGNIMEGRGEVRTGSASASSSSSATVNSDGETKVETKAEAEANGKKVEAQIKKEDSKENISVQKEVKDDGAEAKVDIGIEANSKGNIAEGNGDQKNTDQDENQSSSQNTSDNFFAQAISSISKAIKAIKGVFDSLISFIS